MEAEERVIVANAATLARATAVTMDLGPDARDALGPGTTSFASDLRIARALGPDATFGPWLERPEPADLAVVRLPKERDRLAMALAMARGCAREVALVGHNKAGIRSAPAVMREHVGEARTLDARAHCRLLLAPVTITGPSHLEQWRQTFDALGLKVVSYPGVFSHGRLDPGTEMLLGALERVRGARALDVGCGSGVVAAWLATHGATVTAVDVDAVALAATAETLRANEAVASVLPSDVYDEVTERFDLIVSNPPFHRGVRTTSTVAARLIGEAPEHLARDGELWVVANRFLDYPEHMRARFAQVEEVAGDSRFRVVRARGPERPAR